MTQRAWFVFAFAFALALIGPASYGDAQRFEFDQTLGTEAPIDPFGATPPEVVDQMLSFASLNADDLVYDLGSGDGRIPIAAAQRGARGVGIELRPELVEKSRQAAKLAGVAERARFIQDDIFQVDISHATLVTLYLYPRTLLKLRSKLLTELRPGTRIVAFDYGIEAWPRDAEQALEYYEQSMLYLWIVPANVSGLWDLHLSTAHSESRSLRLQLDQSFQQLRARAWEGDRQLHVRGARVQGRNLTFVLNLGDDQNPHWITFQAGVDGHSIQGAARHANAPTGSDEPHPPFQWKANRDPDSIRSILPPQPASDESADQ